MTTINPRLAADVYKQLYEDGLTIAQISVQTGVSPSTIGRWLYGFFNFPRKGHSEWTEERDKTLTEMWEAGASAAQIGEKIGVTRNAVLGRRYRLGLGSPREPTGGPKTRSPRVFRAPTRKFAVQAPVEPGGPFVPFMEHQNSQCRAVMGRGEDQLATYCGQERRRSITSGKYLSSYCQWHHLKYHQRVL